MRQRRLAIIGLAVVAALTAACGGGADPAAPGDPTDPSATDSSPTDAAPAEPVELTVTIPFPGGSSFYPLFVAQTNGYFAEEGLEVSVQAMDGSGPAIQQVLTGQADIGLGGPADMISANFQGGDLISVYPLYQTGVFSLVAPTGGDVTSTADLEGTVIGVGSKEGGETSFLQSALAATHGWIEGQDYKLLAVGDGGSATVALTNNEVSAYAGAFIDIAIMQLRGVEVTDITPDEGTSYFDATSVVTREFAEANPDVIEGFGRAVAKATVWGMNNPDEVLEIAADFFPEEGEDMEFAMAVLEQIFILLAMPDCADGQWGTACEETTESFVSFLEETGQIPEGADASVFTNEFVPAFNDFDEGALG